MLLYHCNVGWPIVDEGAEILIPATAVREIQDDPPGDYTRIGPPEPAGVERVYEHELGAAADGRVTVAVVNSARELGFVQRFRRDQLPIHNLWRMLAEGFYCLGLEPATNHDSGRWLARERGELQMLDAGEIRTYQMDLEVIEGAAAVDAVRAEVRTCGGSDPDATPP